MARWRRLALTLHVVVLLTVGAGCAGVQPKPEAPISFGDRVDAVIRRVMEDTKAPSASVAVVRDGALVYAKAFGSARLSPAIPATSQTRYRICSLSKQFTAAAVLLLEQDGALSIDDPVSRWFPDFPWAKTVTLRAALSHTAGIRDWWPQDYTFKAMLSPTSPDDVLGQWARTLDFEPGTEYQYGNTGYVLAGRIVEKVSGRSLFDFQRERIFSPLGMHSVRQADDVATDRDAAEAYVQYGIRNSPLRIPPPIGKGWLFGACHLAMTAEDLARWDMAMIEGKILSPKSWNELTTEVRLSNGFGTHYGLGVGVRLDDSMQRVVRHYGDVPGIVSINRVFLDRRAAVAVQVNVAGRAANDIVGGVEELILEDESPDTTRNLARARQILSGFQEGRVDRSLFTENWNHFFTAEVLADVTNTLVPLGAVKAVAQKSVQRRGGMETRIYKATLERGSLEIVQRQLPDGKLEQFMVSED